MPGRGRRRVVRPSRGVMPAVRIRSTYRPRSAKALPGASQGSTRPFAVRCGASSVQFCPWNPWLRSSVLGFVPAARVHCVRGSAGIGAGSPSADPLASAHTCRRCPRGPGRSPPVSRSVSPCRWLRARSLRSSRQAADTQLPGTVRQCSTHLSPRLYSADQARAGYCRFQKLTAQLPAAFRGLCTRLVTTDWPLLLCTSALSLGTPIHDTCLFPPPGRGGCRRGTWAEDTIEYRRTMSRETTCKTWR